MRAVILWPSFAEQKADVTVSPDANLIGQDREARLADAPAIEPPCQRHASPLPDRWRHEQQSPFPSMPPRMPDSLFLHSLYG